MYANFFYLWSPLKTHARRVASKFFRQFKQKYAPIVDHMRRIFVTNDGKSTADSSDVEFIRGDLIFVVTDIFFISFIFV